MAYVRGKVVSADNADVYQVQVHVMPEMLDREPVPAGTPAKPGAMIRQAATWRLTSTLAYRRVSDATLDVMASFWR